MLSSLRQRLHNDEDGFTLIELMVVVLIIAILIAIAIPTFLKVQDSAKNRAAQSDLRNAITTAKVIGTDNAGKFLPLTAAALAPALQAAEKSLVFVDAASSGKNIGVAVDATGDTLVLSRLSATNTMYAVKLLSDGTLTYCQGNPATTAATNTGAACADPNSW